MLPRRAVAGRGGGPARLGAAGRSRDGSSDGRELLRRRLERRGIGLPAVLAALAIGPAAVSGPLQAATAAAAVQFAAGAGEGAAAVLATEMVRRPLGPTSHSGGPAPTVALAAGGVGIAVNVAPIGPRPAPAAADPPRDPAGDAAKKPADDDPAGPTVRILANGQPAVGAKLWSFPAHHYPQEKPPAASPATGRGRDGVVRSP